MRQQPGHWPSPKFRRLIFLLAPIGFWTAARPAGANLIINPTWDASITNDVNNSANIEASITTVIGRIENDISSNVTVSIDFQEISSGLGQSLTWQDSVPYTTYRSALANNQALSPNDRVAVANLPNQATNPVNGNANVLVAAPALRALGQTAPGSLTSAGGNTGTFDGVVSVNTSYCNLTRTGQQNPNLYDLQAVVGHEVNEVLGIGGTGSTLYLKGPYTNQSSPAGAVGALDLYRYGALNARSFTLDPTANAFFSIDGGATRIGWFNQNNNGSDFADWGNGTPNVQAPNSPPQMQDAFGKTGAMTDIGGTELAAIDAIGYDLTATGQSSETLIPEPATGGIFLLAAAGLLAQRKRRSTRIMSESRD